MLKSELLEIIANGENSGIEFKMEDIRPEQLTKMSHFDALNDNEI
jgi:ATP-dependent DNA helicase RecG